eukprot:15433486-Alexandrium_andersonii.AAC.1
MVLTVMRVTIRRSTSAQTRSPELSRDPSCTTFRAERECGNEKRPWSSLGLVVCGCSHWTWRWCR